MKLKTLSALVCSLLVSFAAVADPAQVDTNSTPPTLEGPFIDFLGNLSTWTNLAVAPYGIYDSGSKKAGAGLLALYNISPYVASGIGLQYLDGSVWMPSAQVQFQAPFTIAQKVTLIPFGFTGIGTPVSGRGADNGTAVGIFGAGMATKLYGDTSGRHLSAFFAAAKWTGFDGQQWYFGLAYRF